MLRRRRPSIDTLNRQIDQQKMAVEQASQLSRRIELRSTFRSRISGATPIWRKTGYGTVQKAQQAAGRHS